MSSPISDLDFSTPSSNENEVGVSFSQSMLTFAAVVTFIIMVIGIFGNSLTIAALIKCSKVRNVAAAFIISLCIADLLFCLLVLPFSAFRFIKGTWTHGEILCKLIPFIQYGNIGVSLLCIAIITINRYVMIAHHSVYGKIYTKGWIALMIAFCWLFSYGMQLPTLLGVWGTFGFDARLQTCSIMNDHNGRSSKTTLFIIAFVIPCLIIIICYTKIFWVVHKSEQRLKKYTNKNNSIPNNLRPQPILTNESEQNRSPFNLESDSNFPTLSTESQCQNVSTRVTDQRELKAKRNEWRITRMVLVIFLSFVICYLPITITKVADKEVEYPNWHIMSYIMLYMSACLNPIIYVIMNKQYRKAYKTVIMCEPSQLLYFGKVRSSIAEKWKDIGLNNNHTRTIVSQMSVMDLTNTNLDSSQQQQQRQQLTTVELTIKPNTLNQVPKTIPLRKNTEAGLTQKPQQINSAQSSVENCMNTQQARTILAKNSIQEEEEVQNENFEPLAGEIKEISVNIESKNKNHYYERNINVIPDNLKLKAKLN